MWQKRARHRMNIGRLAIFGQNRWTAAIYRVSSIPPLKGGLATRLAGGGLPALRVLGSEVPAI